jgi:hypothetical protein
MRLFYLLTIVALLFTGCNKTPEPKKEPVKAETNDGPPAWIDDPGRGGVVGAVGQSGPHFKGKAEQRKLAISRAIDELAMQDTVTVDTSIAVHKRGNELSSSTNVETKSYISGSGIPVKAQIKAIWRDEADDTLYVWMIKQ